MLFQRNVLVHVKIGVPQNRELMRKHSFFALSVCSLVKMNACTISAFRTCGHRGSLTPLSKPIIWTSIGAVREMAIFLSSAA